jgi:PilZ domain
MSSEPKIHERRRGERILLHIPVHVAGTSKDGKRVNETGLVVVVSRNGAMLRAKSSLKQGSTVDVIQGSSEAALKFRVVWVSERAREGQFDVGVELTEPREEFWGIRFPPPDRAGQ